MKIAKKSKGRKSLIDLKRFSQKMPQHVCWIIFTHVLCIKLSKKNFHYKRLKLMNYICHFVMVNPVVLELEGDIYILWLLAIWHTLINLLASHRMRAQSPYHKTFPSSRWGHFRELDWMTWFFHAEYQSICVNYYARIK